jgi:hypothetical protein
MAIFPLMIDLHYGLRFQIMHHNACTQRCSILVYSLKINLCNSLRFQIVHHHVCDVYKVHILHMIFVNYLCLPKLFIMLILYVEGTNNLDKLLKDVIMDH